MASVTDYGNRALESFLIPAESSRRLWWKLDAEGVSARTARAIRTMAHEARQPACGARTGRRASGTRYLPAARPCSRGAGHGPGLGPNAGPVVAELGILLERRGRGPTDSGSRRPRPAASRTSAMPLSPHRRPPGDELGDAVEVFSRSVVRWRAVESPSAWKGRAPAPHLSAAPQLHQPGWASSPLAKIVVEIGRKPWSETTAMSVVASTPALCSDLRICSTSRLPDRSRRTPRAGRL